MYVENTVYFSVLDALVKVDKFWFELESNSRVGKVDI